jgi:uncharacterized protein with HEPN domain
VARSILLRLSDIRDAISEIRAMLAGVTFDAFTKNWGMQRAVERGLEIISEASRHVPADLHALAPRIPWRQIAAIGNLLRHEYQRADPLATWNIVEEHLPFLAAAIDELIVEAERRDTETGH